MKKFPFFYVLYPEDKRLRMLLNAIKFISDSTQRTEAHITIRGPYYKRGLTKKDIEKFSNIISGEVLHISNVENFFPYGQNTVYFKCDHNSKLEKIWKKFTYNDFKPHITMYDGDDSDFAIELYNVLSKNFSPYSYRVSALSYLEPKDKDLMGLFQLENQIDDNWLYNLMNKKLHKTDISNLNSLAKLQLIEKVSDILYENDFNYYRQQ
jgi:hypothetical protein